MQTNTIDAPVPQAGRSGVRRPGPWRLGGRARKTTLVVHILSAGTWIGIELVVGVLVITAWLTGDHAVKGIAYQALGMFAVWPMLTTGLVCLASGVLLGLGSKYGLLRYWWVAVKLAMNIVLTALVLLSLRPGLEDVAAHGRALSAGQASHLDVSFLFFPPAVSLTALTFATVLSVFKPWGRIRRRA